MKSRVTAALLAAGVAFTGLLFAASPVQAQATNDDHRKWWNVSFADQCNGTTVVTMKNNLPGRTDTGLVFSINGKPQQGVDPGDENSVEIAYPTSMNIKVLLTGKYDTEPSVAKLNTDQRRQLRLSWEHEWKRPAGCWKVTSTSACDKTFTVNVENTAPVKGYFKLGVNDEEVKLVKVEANAAWKSQYDAGDTVGIKVDGEQLVFKFAQPENCDTTAPPVTTIPTTTVPQTNPPMTPVDNSTDEETLPVTGEPVGKFFMIAGLAVALAVVAGGTLWYRKRRSLES